MVEKWVLFFWGLKEVASESLFDDFVDLLEEDLEVAEEEGEGLGVVFGHLLLGDELDFFD